MNNENDMFILFRFFYRAGSRKWTNHAPQQPQQRRQVCSSGHPEAPTQCQHVKTLSYAIA